MKNVYLDDWENEANSRNICGVRRPTELGLYSLEKKCKKVK